MSTTKNETAPLLAVGAHPDDVEFGCGGIVVKESHAGRPVHVLVCSQGEAGTFGNPELRTAEAEKAAAIMGAHLHFETFDGDAHLSLSSAHAIRLAQFVRQIRPTAVLAPSTAKNQHPDHWRLGTLTRDAVRLARYGGIEELRHLPPHAIDHLLYYALSPDAEPNDRAPVLVDVSSPAVIAAWKAAMEAHASQMQSRSYAELCLMRARVNGLRAGVEYAIALYPNDPIVVESLTQLARGARGF